MLPRNIQESEPAETVHKQPLINVFVVPIVHGINKIAHKSHRFAPGAVAWSVACLLHKQRSRDRPSHPAYSLVEKISLFR